MTSNHPGRLSGVQQGGVEFIEARAGYVKVKVTNGATAKMAYRVTGAAGWKVDLKDLANLDSPVSQPPVETVAHYVAFELPAGEFEVEFHYEPFEFWIGFWISSLAWTGLGLVVLIGTSRTQNS